MNEKFKLTTIRLRKELFDRMAEACHLMGQKKGRHISMTHFVAEAVAEACEKYEEELSAQST